MNKDKWEGVHELADIMGVTLIDDSKRLPLAEQQDFKITRINGVYSKTPTHQPRKVDPKPSRNAPCPCGSGKKYKKCCL